jgi:CHAT domain-containing protein/tetratricopeptide (TPR) repeat protein
VTTRNGCPSVGRIALGLVCLAALAGIAPSPLQRSETPFEKVRGLIDSGRYVEAELEAGHLVSQLERQTGTGRQDLAEATDLFVEALVRNGRGAQARSRTLAERTVAARELDLGPSHLGLANSLRNLGDVLVEAGEYRMALAPYQRALAIHEAARGSSDLLVAEDLDHSARAWILIGQYDEAAAAVQRALDIKEAKLEPSDSRLARTLEIQGLLLQRRGQYSRARPLFDRALSIYQGVNPLHPDTAGCLSLLGQQLWLEGDLVQAKAFSSTALSIGEQVLRTDHPNIASYLLSLAISVTDLGELAEARAMRARALTIAEKTFGPDHPAVALQLNDLANSLVVQGDYAAARLLYERALKVYELRVGPDNVNTTTAVYNLAIVNGALGDFVEARRLFGRVLSTLERTVAPDHPFLARALAAFAEALAEAGLDKEAKPNYERALTIRERTLGETHRDVARTLTMLATTEAKLGNLDRAIALSTRAVTIWEQSNERETRRAADALGLHGTLQANQGNYEAARRSYDRALVILGRVVGSSHPSYAATQSYIAEAFAMDRRAPEAIRNAIDGEDIVRGNLRVTLRYLPERQALGYAAKRAKGLDVALSVLDLDPAATAVVLDAVIRGRALVLDEMAGRHRGAEEFSPDAAPLWTELTSARQRLANLVVKGPGQQKPEQYLALVEEARRDKERAERALVEKSGAFRAEMDRAETGLDRVRTWLPSGSAVLSFVRYDRTDIAGASVVNARPGLLPQERPYPQTTIPSYAAFVLRSGQREPIVVALGDAAEIDKLVSHWRTEAATGLVRSPGSPRAAERSLRTSGDRLRSRIWDPIARYIEGTSRLFVVPDGALNLMPLAALPVGQSEYLLEKGPIIHYLAAERDLVPVDGSATHGQGLLAVGAPSFSDRSQFAALAERQPSSGRLSGPTRQQKPEVIGAEQSAESGPNVTPFRGPGSDCASFQTMRFEPLPGSGREAEDVARLWKDFAGGSTGAIEPTTVLAGRSADERTFKRRAPGQRVLHLATHGFFLGSDCTSAVEGTRAVGGLVSTKPKTAKSPSQKSPQPRPTIGENPLLLSGLAMAGANRRAAARADEDDGILTAEEVASLNLKGVEWAVLSACDTGLGEIKAGEGVFGLRRAFQVAGAHTVIMSLWSVEDRAAMEWMRALYEGRLRRGLDTAEAVREASISVLHQRRARGQSVHPFYWAGFVASGDWR